MEIREGSVESGDYLEEIIGKCGPYGIHNGMPSPMESPEKMRDGNLSEGMWSIRSGSAGRRGRSHTTEMAGDAVGEAAKIGFRL